MTFDPSQTYLYVTSDTNQVLKYNAETGAFVGVAASAGLSGPADVKFGPDGLLYVLSAGNNRIPRFTAGCLRCGTIPNMRRRWPNTR